MRNASQLRQEFEALTGSIYSGQNRYDDFNTGTQGVQRQGCDWREPAQY